MSSMLKCSRLNCPCTSRAVGHPYCCRTCASGTACAANYHKASTKCSRPNCPCTSCAVGHPYCCRTYATGTACVTNYHK
jgi:hypothetical protein